MILIVGISPIVLIVLGAILILNIPAWAVITLVAMTLFSLMGSLAIVTVMASKMSPKVGLDNVRYQRYTAAPVRVTDLQPPPSSVTSTAIARTEPISQVAEHKTYKRMIGRRVVEFDSLTHEPVDPDLTNMFPAVKDDWWQQ